jgi:peptidoglycan hydrolase CwlO-like protein
MISLEQVKLLETKVTKAIEHVERITSENTALRAKLDSYQKRIDELEVLVMRFKEDQGRIEDGILAALDRLNQFEGAIEKSLKEKQAAANKSLKSADAVKPPAAKSAPAAASPAAPAAPVETPAPAEMFFEIPEEETDDDLAEPLAEIDLPSEADKSGGEKGELDIF